MQRQRRDKPISLFLHYFVKEITIEGHIRKWVCIIVHERTKIFLHFLSHKEIKQIIKSFILLTVFQIKAPNMLHFIHYFQCLFLHFMSYIVCFVKKRNKEKKHVCTSVKDIIHLRNINHTNLKHV